jgi:hypothetical protein
MTTHGSPRKNPRPATPKVPQVDQSNMDLDLDDWLTKRMLNERRIKIGGEWFRFSGSGTADQLAEFNKALADNAQTVEILAILLVDPSEVAELAAAFARQRQPMGKDRSEEMTIDIVNHLLKGVDLGES